MMSEPTPISASYRPSTLPAASICSALLGYDEPSGTQAGQGRASDNGTSPKFPMGVPPRKPTSEHRAWLRSMPKRAISAAELPAAVPTVFGPNCALKRASSFGGLDPL